MTTIINAVTTTPRVHKWLESSHSPRMLHVFNRAFNLINENHEVLSVVMPEIGNGPFNLVVETAPLFTSNINFESPVSNTLTELRIDHIRIQTQDAQLWDPHPHWSILHSKRESILQRVNELETHFSATSLQFSNALASALANADLPSCISAATKLAGLGQGLTPSGDDYMMGALYAGWIIHPRKIAERIAVEVADVAAPLTASLSGAWLKAAGNGEAGIAWHAFFESLVHGKQDAINKNLSNILSVGATSGADALAGFIDTIISYAELERKYVVP